MIDRSLLRFLIVGIVNTIVGLSLMFILLHIVKLNYFLSTSIGNIVGAIVSYVLNRSYTFRSDANVIGSLIRFFCVILVCYALSYGTSYFGVAILVGWGLNKKMSESIAVIFGAGLYTILNYIGHKYFSFRSDSIKKGGVSA